VSKEFVKDLIEKKARKLIGMSLYSCKGVSLRSQITKEEAVCFINQLIKEVIQETGVEIEE